jgi:hypothetical protein
MPLLPPLLPTAGERKLSTIQLKKKAIANTVVALDRKVAAPLPPKTAPVMPEPPNAPAKPSPLADCIRTAMIKAIQIKTCKKVKNTIKCTSCYLKWFKIHSS